jgi:tetratricopeptide (TPR) repeat protein
LKSRLVVAGLSVLLVAAFAGASWARNPHCAGGIQYVVQGLRDKEKGNTEDYLREMNKAVDQLSLGATEDPADYEAMGYLGWAYAEIDSGGPAGEWFAKALAGGQAKGDKKKVDAIQSNRDHYWSIAFNDGIKNIQDAQQFMDAGAKDDAARTFAVAVTKLTRAHQIRPGHPQTIRNLATAYALAGDNDGAEATLSAGLVEAAADTGVHILSEALRTVRANKALALVDAKKYDEAIAYYIELAKQDPASHDLWMGLGNCYFNRATVKADPPRSDAARKADFKLAADAYSKAYELKTTDLAVAFNAALSYQNAGEVGLAEAQWRTVLKATPDDPEALSSLGSVLADEKKYDEAQASLQRAVEIKPDEKVFFRQLAAVYSKQNNSPKMTEMMFVYLPMANGQLQPDPVVAAKAAKPASAAANTFASQGAPDKVYNWTDNTAGALQTWFYTAKRLAFTFNSSGALAQKSDWNAKKK